MTHPFQDKLVVFIGRPQRCTRQAAHDALVAVGGIPDDRIVAFTSYAVAFANADKTKKYMLALKHEREGLLSILAEEEFFDIIDGRTAPPEKPINDKKPIVIPARDPQAEACESERMMEDILNRRRMNNLARHGVPTSDGRVKVDLRRLDAIAHVLRKRKEQN